MSTPTGSDTEKPVLTIPAALRRAVAEFGDVEAVVDGEVRFDYRELGRRVDVVRRALMASGVRRGDRVAIWAPNVWEWVVVSLGISTAGSVLVPLNTRYKATEAAYILARSRAKLLFTLDGFLGNDYVAPILHRMPELPDLVEVVDLRSSDVDGATDWATFEARAESVSIDEADARARSVEPGDLNDILFTSGTTGRPKGVMVTHQQNARLYVDYADRVGILPRSRYLMINPYFHSFGYKAGILTAVLRGVTMVPVQVLDLAVVCELIDRERIEVLPGPPTLYQAMLDHPDREQHDLESLRVAITGAATVPVQLIERMRDELTFDTVITAYGLTESSGTATTCVAEDEPETIARTAGTAVDGVELKIVDSTGAELPPGEPGEVLVRGYCVMVGYLDDPEGTRQAIDPDGWLHTGDVGTLDERGYLRITDRLKDMFIVGGFNAYPAEIENLLLGHEGLSEVAVVGVPDERLGEVGVAFVVPRRGATVTPEALITWSRERMANYKVPRRVEVLSALPKNATGKIAKLELRERAASSAP